MDLYERIKQAKEFGTWLHGRTNGRVFPGGVRERASLAITQQSEDVADAILVLLEAQLPGPALALSRPLFEGYVRGYWLMRYASDKQVEEFMRGTCPNFPRLLRAIPKDAESGGAWIHANAASNLPTFHNLTHGGSEHIKRRVLDGVVEPAYPESELASLVMLSNEVRVCLAAELLTIVGDEESMEELNGWAQLLRAHP